jgi:hypothetical protein
MDGGPGQPGAKPAQAHPTRLQDGEVAADQRHIPFIEVAEWPGRGLAGVAWPPRLYGNGHGAAFQMSAAYSAMVRSLENFPDPATFRMALRAHPSESA